MIKKIEIRTQGNNNIKLEHDEESIHIILKVDIEEVLQEFTVKELVNNIHEIELREIFELLKVKFN